MIHCYKNNGYNIVLDVNSGSVHVVDDIVYDMIQLIEPIYEQGVKDADTLTARVRGHLERAGRPVAPQAVQRLDVETTGLNTHADEIIEIGAVRIENGAEVAAFSELVNPGRPVPEKVVEITGIT